MRRAFPMSILNRPTRTGIASSRPRRSRAFVASVEGVEARIAPGGGGKPPKDIVADSGPMSTGLPTIYNFAPIVAPGTTATIGAVATYLDASHIQVTFTNSDP